jgi:hypothetical protein
LFSRDAESLDLLINQKKALHRLNDERLCSTDGNVADSKLSCNGYAISLLGERLLVYGVISSRLELTAYQRITLCLEIQHRVLRHSQLAFIRLIILRF